MGLTIAIVRRQWNTSATFSRELTLWELAGYVAGALKRHRREPSGTSLAPSFNRG
jgi:hypothetical protein